MNWRKIAGGLLLMLAGGFITMGTEHLMLLHHRGTHHRPAPASTPAIIATLDEVLDLSSAQRDSIEKVMERHQTAIDSAWRAIHHELGSSMDSVHKEMGRILTAEQDRKFRDWLRGQGMHH